MQTPFLIGSSIYLRPLERADIPVLVPWLNHPDVNRTLARYRPMNRDVEEGFISGLYSREHEVVLGIVVKQTDAFIGCTGLHDIDFKNRHAQFGIFIGETAEWGKGYGTAASRLMVSYAFETLNLNRVWLRVFESNEGGVRAYEKAGFRREGLLRQEDFREGRYRNTVLMAVLREEWGG